MQTNFIFGWVIIWITWNSFEMELACMGICEKKPHSKSFATHTHNHWRMYSIQMTHNYFECQSHRWQFSYQVFQYKESTSFDNGQSLYSDWEQNQLKLINKWINMKWKYLMFHYICVFSIGNSMQVFLNECIKRFILNASIFATVFNECVKVGIAINEMISTIRGKK